MATRRGRGLSSNNKDNPKTSEINAFWKKQGRMNTADNALTKLVKEKRLSGRRLGASGGVCTRLCNLCDAVGAFR